MRYTNLFRVGCIIAAIAAFSGCFKKLEEYRKTESNIPVVEFVPFSGYNPEIENMAKLIGNVDIDDLLLSYLKGDIKLGELIDISRDREFDHEKRDPEYRAKEFSWNPAKKPNIKDYESWEQKVFQTAEKLGYSREDIPELSIFDSVFLSGEIVGELMEYFHQPEGMAREKYFDILRESDRLSDDELVDEEHVVCRHYARVNRAVFQVLKKHNELLGRTIMSYIRPESSEHFRRLPHAWNKVMTADNDTETLEFTGTVVDPTWLDVYTDPEDPLEEKLRYYDAFDKAHYDNGSFYLNDYLAQLFEELGDAKSGRSIFDYRKERYVETANEFRHRICGNIINIYDDMGENEKRVADERFCYSFMSLVSNAIGISAYSLGDFSEKYTAKLDEYESLEEGRKKRRKKDMVLGAAHSVFGDITDEEYQLVTRLYEQALEKGISMSYPAAGDMHRLLRFNQENKTVVRP
tara:strand:- start:16874 stop:18265 length:1392 start_codon:yes stop_codon:yes gene_type:complete